MKLCLECGTPLTGRQKQFCSIPCRNKPLGRAHGGRNKNAVKVICENCGDIFKVPLGRATKTKVRACSRKCLGVIQSRERTGVVRPTLGIQTYRRARKDACERCGSTTNLCVHHRDEDRYNNDPANLETFCRHCHQLHHRCVDNLPRGPRGGLATVTRYCVQCGGPFRSKTKNQRCCSFSCARALDHARRRVVGFDQ